MTVSVSPSVPALDLALVDPDTRPQDDLYRHVNGRWLAETEIPEDKPLIAAFTDLHDAAEEAVRDIITGLGRSDRGDGDPGTDEQRITDLYACFTDTETVEAAGAEPLRESLAEVAAVTEVSDLPRLFGRLIRRGTTSVLGADVDADPGDPQRYALFLGQSGLGLPDEEYYRAEEYADIRGHYVDHIRRTLALAGVTDGSDSADLAGLVVGLETEIAARHWDKVTTRDMRKMYNPSTVGEVEAPGLDLRTVLRVAGLDASAELPLINAMPSFFAGLGELLTADRLPAWRAWAAWHTVSAASPYLSAAFVEERFAFYGTTLSGTPQLKERWKRGVDLVEGVLGEAVGKIYVERHFPPTAKARMDDLVANLIEAYRRSITTLDWMTEPTRAEALDKLAKFTPKIGFPEQWRDYSGLQIVPGDLIGNVLRATEFDLDYEFAKVGRPVLAHEWFMTPQTVNAYYHPLRNEIVFPAAICQPPFFNPDADDAVNYGAIGSVIGHEIGHGFDDQGSTCDGDGRLRDWWTEADREAFEERTAALVAQFNALEPAQLPGQHVNGELTVGENIGDLGGLMIAYQAWQIATEGNETEVDGLTGAQRLFFGWAAAWRQKTRTETVRQRLATDPHSPPEFRCNQIVRNLDQFHDAFGVTEADALWLAPQDRVRIW